MALCADYLNRHRGHLIPLQFSDFFNSSTRGFEQENPLPRIEAADTHISVPNFISPQEPTVNRSTFMRPSCSCAKSKNLFSK